MNQFSSAFSSAFAVATPVVAGTSVSILSPRGCHRRWKWRRF